VVVANKLGKKKHPSEPAALPPLAPEPETGAH
jgi:hypothetical protein